MTFLILFLALSAVLLSRPAAAEDRATPLPMLSVSATPHAPTMDGRIGEAEWRFASKTTGFLNLATGQAAEDQTTVWVTYDAQRLYVAFQCELDAESLPQAAETRRDGSVWSDDSFELLLHLPGRQEQEIYHFIGNPLGTIYDDYGRDKKWDGRWEFKTESGRGGWSGELSIPLADLGVKDPTGQTWRVNFARSVGKHTSWADTLKGYLNPPRFGELRFTRDAIVPQVGPLAGLNTAEVNVKARVLNPSAHAAQGVLGVRLAAPASELPRLDTAAWRPVRRASLPVGAHTDLSVTVNAPKEGPQRLDIALTDATGQELYRQAIPFLAQGLRYVELLPDPSEESLFVRVTPRGLGKGQPVDLFLSFEHSGKALRQERAYKGLAAKPVVFREDVRTWPLGAYQVKARLVAGTERLHEAELRYERVAAPDWFTVGRTLGLSRQVLKPWTPAKWDNRTLAVWGRDHDFAQSLLPAQIVSAGQPLLTQPASLKAVCDGQPSEARLGRRETLASEADAVVTRAEGQMGPLTVQLTTTAEYDGLLKFELELRPRGEVRLERLWLSLPARPQRALYYHLASSYYAKGESGAVPSGGMRLAFYPFVWLGDNERGLMWFAESQQAWQSDRECIHVQTGPNATELRVEFVNQPTTLSQPKRLVFGLQATPVKPVPPDWRAWRADYIHPPRIAPKLFMDWKAEGVPIQWRLLWWTDGQKRIFTEGHTTPLQIKPDLAKYVEAVHREGTRIVPYFYLHGVSDNATGFDRYYAAWQTTNPREMAYYGRLIMGACPGSAFGDYLLYGIYQMVKQYKIDGAYFDGAAPPVPCGNELHGHGWIDETGVRKDFYPIFALRTFYKRLATMLSEHVKRPVIWIHSDGKISPPSVSFVTANWEGEMVQGSLQRGDVFLSDLLSLDFCRAHLMATQWGVVPMWLPSIFGPPEQRKRQALDTMALLLVHGTPIGRVGSFDAELLAAVWKAQAAFGIDQATFHGYWQNADRLKLSPTHDRVVASLYERDGRRMIIVSNFTPEPRPVSLELTSPPAAHTLKDPLSGETYPSANGRFTLTIAPHSFRLMLTGDK